MNSLRQGWGIGEHPGEDQGSGADGVGLANGWKAQKGFTVPLSSLFLQLLQHQVCAALPGHHCPCLPLSHPLQLPDQGQPGVQGRDKEVGLPV